MGKEVSPLLLCIWTLVRKLSRELSGQERSLRLSRDWPSLGQLPCASLGVPGSCCSQKDYKGYLLGKGSMHRDIPRRDPRTPCPGWVRTQAVGCVEQGDRATAVTPFRNARTSVPLPPCAHRRAATSSQVGPTFLLGPSSAPSLSCLKCRGLSSIVKGAHSSVRHSQSLAILLYDRGWAAPVPVCQELLIRGPKALRGLGAP